MKSDNVSRELHEISQELFATKLELTKQHSIVKDLSKTLEESKKLTKNMKKEKTRSEKESILSKKTFENEKAKYEKVNVEVESEAKCCGFRY